jgi:hypothetical protein
MATIAGNDNTAPVHSTFPSGVTVAGYLDRIGVVS